MMRCFSLQVHETWLSKYIMSSSKALGYTFCVVRGDEHLGCEVQQIWLKSPAQQHAELPDLGQRSTPL